MVLNYYPETAILNGDGKTLEPQFIWVEFKELAFNSAFKYNSWSLKGQYMLKWSLDIDDGVMTGCHNLNSCVTLFTLIEF